MPVLIKIPSANRISFNVLLPKFELKIPSKIWKTIVISEITAAMPPTPNIRNK